MTGPIVQDAANTAAFDVKVEGNGQDLLTFVAVCEKLERTGSWTCVEVHLRQEVIAFSTKHGQEIQKYVRLRCKDASQVVVQHGEPTSPSASGRTGSTGIVAQSSVFHVCPAHSLFFERFAGGAHRDEAAVRQQTLQGCLGISCKAKRQS
ncbi:unnamed protein product [Symbiodinium necroappetens]|uniref:Uncharacterized protein n=1 Tax=Symbiodinium necroappetens TaxID=1628268 RepID=A0A812LW33_9DINO|nr:unnamed protein product [Symbiodinium necroappetens]